MSSAQEAWQQWRERSRQAAEERWRQLGHDLKPDDKGRGESKGSVAQVRLLDGRTWEDEIRKRLRELQDMDILQPRGHQRLQRFEFRELAHSDQKRLQEIGERKGVYAMALSKEKPGDTSKLSERFLQLTEGKWLRGGRLNIQVFVDDPRKHLLGMNIHLQGVQVLPATRTTAETQRPLYMRYDLDAVPMGQKKGPVTHFRAHWHLGEDPDASEDSDPRMPSLVLDPTAVLETLIETFFPEGPEDLLPPVSPRPPDR